MASDKAQARELQESYSTAYIVQDSYFPIHLYIRTSIRIPKHLHAASNTELVRNSGEKFRPT